MKHLKTYENQGLLAESLKIGDYIFVDLSNFNDNYIIDNDLPSDYLHQPAKITVILDNRHEFPYEVKFKNESITQLNDEEIIRKLTDIEVEEFETHLTAKKYNL